MCSTGIRRAFHKLRVMFLIVSLASCRSYAGVQAPTTALPTAIEQSSIRMRIPLPQGARSVAFGGGSIWVTNPAENTVLRIDMETGEAAGSPISLDFAPGEIAYGEGAAWVVSEDRSRLARINPETNAVAAEVDLRSLAIPTYNLLLIAAGEGAVWLTDQMNIIQIDPQTNRVVGEPLPAGEEIIAVALGHGTFWTGSHDDGIITRVDARTQRVVASFQVGFSIHGLAVGDEAAWVLDEHGFGVVQIDPQNNQLQGRVPIDFIGANLAAGAGSVWVAPAARDSGAATGNDGIVRIREADSQIVETIHVGDMPASEYYSAYFGAGSLWILVDTPQPSIVQIIP